MSDPLDGEIADRMSLTLTELCVRVGVHADLVVELVSCGVVEAHGARPDEWAFDLRALERSRTAMRLHRDLGLDWRNLALALDLLEEVERLRRRVELLEHLHGAGGILSPGPAVRITRIIPAALAAHARSHGISRRHFALAMRAAMG